MTEMKETTHFFQRDHLLFLTTEAFGNSVTGTPFHGDSESLINRFYMTFVLIRPGIFVMGSPADESGRESDETPHRVTLTKAFYMQTTPVTQDQWYAVMGSSPSCFKGGSRPMEQVSWNDTQIFISRMNRQEKGTYRLPTEAEWEYACRAGTS